MTGGRVGPACRAVRGGGEGEAHLRAGGARRGAGAPRRRGRCARGCPRSGPTGSSLRGGAGRSRGPAGPPLQWRAKSARSRRVSTSRPAAAKSGMSSSPRLRPPTSRISARSTPSGSQARIARDGAGLAHHRPPGARVERELGPVLEARPGGSGRSARRSRRARRRCAARAWSCGRGCSCHSARRSSIRVQSAAGVPKAPRPKGALSEVSTKGLASARNRPAASTSPAEIQRWRVGLTASAAARRAAVAAGRTAPSADADDGEEERHAAGEIPHRLHAAERLADQDHPEDDAAIGGQPRLPPERQERHDRQQRPENRVGVEQAEVVVGRIVLIGRGPGRGPAVERPQLGEAAGRGEGGERREAGGGEEPQDRPAPGMRPGRGQDDGEADPGEDAGDADGAW